MTATASNARLPKRQRLIRQQLLRSGIATTRQIAESLGMNVNGISQSLGAMQTRGLVSRLEGRGAETVWELRRPD